MLTGLIVAGDNSPNAICQAIKIEKMKPLTTLEKKKTTQYATRRTQDKEANI
jgi:hypothetical protein